MEQGYFIDAELATEMVRLEQQDQLVTDACGSGPFYGATYNPAWHDILDIACGPGGWVRSVASLEKSVQVVGGDISERMVQYAQAQAEAAELTNASFVKMDATKPLPFPDGSFDFVNARFITGFLNRETWPLIIKECWRILRAGGTCQITEGDAYSMVNGPAVSEWALLFTRIMYEMGRTFALHTMGITPMLHKFLAEAGFQHINNKAHAVNLSSSNSLREGFTNDFLSALKLMENFVLKSGILTKSKFQWFQEEMAKEFASPDFRAVWYLLTVWGEKV